MELTIVGSGTIVPSPERVCAAYYIESGPHRVLFDCGAGALHHMARFGVPWDRLTHIALTHFHNDHIGDLPILFFSLKHALVPPRREPLLVIGPEGTTDLFERMAAAFGDHVIDPGFAVSFHEIRDGETFELDATTALRSHRTPHTDNSIAYRLDGVDCAFGYTGDTGPSGALGDFFHGVDTLVSECSLPDDLAIPTHLSPASAAALAAGAVPARLVLTHIYPQVDRTALPRLLVSAGWRGESVLAQDGARLSVAHPRREL